MRLLLLLLLMPSVCCRLLSKPSSVQNNNNNNVPSELRQLPSSASSNSPYFELLLGSCSDGSVTCANGGRCMLFLKTDASSLVYCICPASTFGAHCEYVHPPPSPRWHDACSPSCGHGRCVMNEAAGRAECACEKGWQGKHCGSDIDECAASPCATHGACVNQPGGYRCDCESGYSGALCELFYIRDNSDDEGRADSFCSLLQDRLAICEGVDSRCIDTFDDLGRPYFRCACEEGREGDRCQMKRTAPFVRCATAETCAAAYANGVCDEACNSEECLYDGFDCAKEDEDEAAVCAEAERCAELFANGVCNKECADASCAFDGGDCGSDGRQANQLDGTLILHVDTPPASFMRHLPQFLRGLSARLRANVSPARRGSSNGGQLELFEWDRAYGRGQRIVTGNSSSPSIFGGVEAHLVIDVGHCVVDCFAHIESAAAFINEAITKRSIPSVAAALTATLPQRLEPRGAHSTWSFLVTSLLIAVAFIIVGGAFVLTMMIWPLRTTRKRLRDVLSQTSVFVPGRLGEEPKLLPYDPSDAKRARIQPPPLSSHTWTELHGLASRHMVDKIKSSSGDLRHLVGVRDEHGWTPLHAVVACQTGLPDAASETVQALLDLGADVNAQDEDGNTLLHLVAQQGRITLAMQLLKLRAANVVARNNDGRTPLHYAAQQGDMVIMSMLLDHQTVREHIDVCDVMNRTALMQFILSNGRLTDDGTSKADFIRRFKQSGANLDHAGEERCVPPAILAGYTALHYAAEVGATAIAAVLIELEADVNATDDVRRTPLHIAVHHGSVSITSLLLDHGADVLIVTDDTRESPLDVARRCGARDLIKMIEQQIEKRQQSKLTRGKSGRKFKTRNSGVAKQPRMPAIYRREKRRSNDTGYSSSVSPPRTPGAFSEGGVDDDVINEPEHFDDVTATEAAADAPPAPSDSTPRRPLEALPQQDAARRARSRSRGSDQPHAPQAASGDYRHPALLQLPPKPRPRTVPAPLTHLPPTLPPPARPPPRQAPTSGPPPLQPPPTRPPPPIPQQTAACFQHEASYASLAPPPQFHAYPQQPFLPGYLPHRQQGQPNHQDHHVQFGGASTLHPSNSYLFPHNQYHDYYSFEDPFHAYSNPV